MENIVKQSALIHLIDELSIEKICEFKDYKQMRTVVMTRLPIIQLYSVLNRGGDFKI